MSSTIEKLPTELLSLILTHILTTSDHKSLCLTSRRFRHVATPVLYHAVYLHLPSLALESGFFDATNPGPASIRELTLAFPLPHSDKRSGIGHQSPPGRYDLSHARALCFSAINLVPMDKLRFLSFNGTFGVDPNIGQLLSSRQRCLRSLHVWDKCTTAGSFEQPDTWLRDLQDVTIPVSCSDSDEGSFYHSVLRLCPNIRSLSIASSWRMGSGDVLERFGSKLKPVFEATVPAASTTPHGKVYEHVCLVDVDLTHFNVTLASFIDFTQLATLCLNACSNAGPLLEYLAESFCSGREMRIRGFRLFEILDLDLMTVERFLESFSGLKFIQIDLEDLSRKLNLEWLAKQAATLERVLLKFGDPWEGIQHCYSAEQLISVVKGCPLLQQLAIELPKMTLTPLEKASFDDDYMRAFGHARHLQYFRILNWPAIADQWAPCSCDSAAQTMYHGRLDQLANTMMQVLTDDEITPPSQLRLLCIGVPDTTSSDYTLSREIHRDPCIYMPAQCYVPGYSADGKEVVAKSIDRLVVRYLHPSFDMFTENVCGIDDGIGLMDIYDM